MILNGTWSWDINNGYDVLVVSSVVLVLSVVLLEVCFCWFQRENPSVPKKNLPCRPVLNIHFKPEDTPTISSSSSKSKDPKTETTQTTASMTTSSPWRKRLTSFHGDVATMTRQLFARKSWSSSDFPLNNKKESRDYQDFDDDERDDHIHQPPSAKMDNRHDLDLDDDDFDEDQQDPRRQNSNNNEPAFVVSTDLPDSFAPLLSSSHVEIARSNLTADLIHALSADASVRLFPGRHEIPLNKDASRPQFILDVPAQGCRISASLHVGSDGFDLKADLDPSVQTSQRTKPIVKHAVVTLDPPLPLANVAPTLIHFPTLFVDKLVTRLRRIYVFRFVIDFIISMSSFLERCLWLVESKCQIHLSKAQMVLVYKGLPGLNPNWHLTPAFSGHVLLFGFIPIPFISVVLPSFIIPHPHALLDSLISKQPFASARLKRENIAEQKIAIAAVAPVDKWTAEFKLLGTPPAVGIDITLPGGLSVAVEMGLGRDPTAQSKTVQRNNPDQDKAQDEEIVQPTATPTRGLTRSNSLSSWSTNNNNNFHQNYSNRDITAGSVAPPRTVASTPSIVVNKVDANRQTPWLVDFKAKGTCTHEKIGVQLLKFVVSQQASTTNATSKDTNNYNMDSRSGTKVANSSSSRQGDSHFSSRQGESHFSTSGSIAIWKIAETSACDTTNTGAAKKSFSSWNRLKRSGAASRPALEDDSPSVAAILLFPEETTSFHPYHRMLQYDYALDVTRDSKLDAVTLSIGAFHPLLKGGTTITTILDTIYAYGSMSAREDAILDPLERKRKRNILKHLPAIDFSCGVQNIYIPPESESYSDDGQTLFLPELEGGRMMLRFLGGIDDDDVDWESKSLVGVDPVSAGVMVVGDFEVASLMLRTEGAVKEFPELEVYEGIKLKTNLSGSLNGRVQSHLRPQPLTTAAAAAPAGPNIFNPLEAYEIDFSGTSLSVKMREYAAVLGHRRIILPAESAFVIGIIESVVDMGFEGKTLCELSWDFQGLSPILQVTPPGESPEDALPEGKEQVSLLIAPLRQGRFSLQISSVGGIEVKKAATSRDHKEGLYDWKFFNALVSPDESSAKRIYDVLHDKRTMLKLLQVVKLINVELHNIMEYSLRQVWRAKEILDAEGVSDPGHAIPMYKMARLISMFLTGDTHEVSTLLPLIRRVVDGDGLDTVKVKELLRHYLPSFEEWAPELDRALRWVTILMGPMTVSPNVAGQDVTPLAEVQHHAIRFRDIPTAQQLYNVALEQPQLPLDPVFSKLVSRVAPYLSFRQIEFLLESRTPVDWQQEDLRRIRYVYSIKKKVLQIAESYGGFSFLPQSFLVSVFLGEATKSSLRLSNEIPRTRKGNDSISSVPTRSRLGLRLRKRRVLESSLGGSDGGFVLSPAQRAAAKSLDSPSLVQEEIILEYENTVEGLSSIEAYQLGDSLLGPQDVAILLQSGLTSVMKSSTVVQLNQRMLLDLICSQPHSFAVAVLAEIGSPGGEGSPRSLTSALMSLLELDQTAFTDRSKIDMHALLESWLPGLKVPRRDDYMAGGRWARQSYYEAIFAVATSILEDAESYMALKAHLQRVRHNKETDPIPAPLGELDSTGRESEGGGTFSDGQTKKYELALNEAKNKIEEADEFGHAIMDSLISETEKTKSCDAYKKTIEAYRAAFASCAALLELDRYAFQMTWFREFYLRNYEALMIKSVYDNVIDNVDHVRHWLQALRNGAMGAALEDESGKELLNGLSQEDANSKNRLPVALQESESMNIPNHFIDSSSEAEWETLERAIGGDGLFMEPEYRGEQVLVDAIIDAIIYNENDRERLRKDPLVRLLIPNPPGVHYNFAIVSAMGVITEGERGLELKDAFKRLEKERGVIAVRAGTGTARSLEYNANKIEQAIENVVERNIPYGLLGYSQGCANALMAETMMNSGTPKQRKKLRLLVCRQLLFSAANGSVHGPGTDAKVNRLIILCEEFFKYQQGYASRALADTVLGMITNVLDSSDFHKFMGGAQSFLQEGCRAFWREAQHLAHVPTCTVRGVLERHTTPECLEMLSNLLTKQSGSNLHDSQVHSFDAVGYPVYHRNRNGRIMERCDVGDGSIQRTHHWSPLSDEVEFVQTKKDLEQGSFQCAKDRHVFPWVEVNARFGFIKPLEKPTETYMPDSETEIRSKLGLL